MRRGDILVTRQGAWFANRHLPCAIGRGGITADKREGDGATPSGIHRITGCFYRPDRLSAPVDWATPLRPGDLWSDAPEDARYNTMVRAPYTASHEALRRPDPLYDIILPTDWNWPNAVPGCGSAIFVHVWRKPRHPTEGCVAFARSDLLWLLDRIDLDTRLIVHGM